MSCYDLYESLKNPITKIKMEQREERIKNLVANTDYIAWLSDFTLINGDFFVNDWEYSKTKLPKQEMENVKKLGDFYSAISEYADRNYIYPEDTKVSKYYRVKYHCSMLHVGYIGNKEPEFFCARQELDDESKYIDIEDIIDNKKQAHVPIIEKSLNQLDKRIIKLHEDGIPGEAIELSLKKTLIKLRENKN